MDIAERKPNRLRDYDYSNNGAYFITICTQGRKPMLSTIVGDDAHIVPKPYGLIAEKYIRNVLEIEKYVLMPDHIHMIIRLNDGPMWASAPTDANAGVDSYIRGKSKISSIVRSIKILTTKEIGTSIFQRSFYDHVIRNQQDYDEIWQYIDNNPRKWVIEKENRD